MFIVFEIKRYIGRKSRFSHTPFYTTTPCGETVAHDFALFLSQPSQIPGLPGGEKYTMRTGPPRFKRHNLVNIRFIYMKISGNIAEGMLSLHV